MTHFASVIPLDRNSPAEFEAAYRTHFASMMRVAYLMTGSNSIAEDMVHDTFIRCAPKLGEVANPGGYLRTAVVNACRTDWRKRQRSEPMVVEPVAVPASDADVLEVRDALMGMSQRRRAAVVLRFYEDLSYEQIAEALGCRPGTARSLVHRGLADLKGTLR